MIWIIFILFMIAIISLFIYSRKFLNPYRLYMVFGKKGSGKTTYLVKLILRYHKLGRPVYTTLSPDEISDTLDYVHFVKAEDIGRFVPPPEAVLLVDEVGMIWDNRNFKNFRADVRDYFKLQRHYRNIVYLFSQTFDIDIKLRTLTDAMFLVTSPIPILSVVRRIKRTIVLVQPVADAEGRIADSLEFVPWYLNLFGAKALQFTWLPKYAKFFNSHEVPDVPVFDDQHFVKKISSIAPIGISDVSVATEKSQESINLDDIL